MNVLPALILFLYPMLFSGPRTNVVPSTPSATLEWDKVSNASYYTLAWSTNSDFTDYSTVDVTNTIVTVTNLIYGMRYYFEVLSDDFYGDACDWSQPVSETIGLWSWTLTALSSADRTNWVPEFTWSTNIWSTNDYAQRYFRLHGVSNVAQMEASIDLKTWQPNFISTNVWDFGRSYRLLISCPPVN